METVTRGQIDFIYIAYGQDKSEVRSRWIEINGTDSVTEEGTSGSYYTVKALVAKYADLAGRVALVFNGKILTFNGKVLTFPGIGSSELDANYLLLRTFLDEMGLDDESEEFENFDWETYSYLLSQYYDSEKRLTERVYDALQNYEELTRNNLTFFLDGYSGTLTTIQQQIDGKAETWYQGTDPSSSWLTDAEKEKHVGDLWYCTANISGTSFEKNTTWYYKSTTTASVTTYAWVQQDVPDEVFDAIDGKATIYINTVASPPTNYRAKDLWILPANATIGGTAYKKGDVLRATQDSVTYDASHWVIATRYTDDTRIDEWSQASNVTPVEKQELKNIYEQEYGAKAEISAKLALYVSDIHSVQEFEDYLDAFDDLEGVIDYYTGSSTWEQVIPESSSYKISETLTAYYDAKRIINNKISALAQSDYGYLKQYLRKDTTIVTDGFVLSGFIGVVRTDDTPVPPEDYIIAGINADENLSGWQDQDHGTLLIAAGISNGSMSTAATNARFRLFEDGAMFLRGYGSGFIGISTTGNYCIWAGNSTASSAPFSVTSAGEIKSTSGTIGGFTISATTLGTADDTSATSRFGMYLAKGQAQWYNADRGVGSTYVKINCVNAPDSTTGPTMHVASTNYDGGESNVALKITAGSYGDPDPIALQLETGRVSGLRPKTRHLTTSGATYGLLSEYDFNVVFDKTPGSQADSIYLPQYPQEGQMYNIYNIKGGDVIINGNGTKIKNVLSTAAAANTVLMDNGRFWAMLVCVNSLWYLVYME